jgi:hypothetical protein
MAHVIVHPDDGKAGIPITNPDGSLIGASTTSKYTNFPLPATLPSVATALTAAAGQFGAYSLINTTSAPVYLEIWDTVGAVTLGTTAPNIIVPIPANATPANGSAANMALPNGGKITNGMKYCFVTAAYGATAVTTGVSGTIWGL